MKILDKVFIRLTAKLPRRMPITMDEFESLKLDLIQGFGLKDEPNVWITVAGQIISQRATQVKITYRDLVNVARRLDINKIAHDQRALALEKLQAKLKEAIANLPKEENAEVREGASNFQGDVPSVQESQGGVV